MLRSPDLGSLVLGSSFLLRPPFASALQMCATFRTLSVRGLHDHILLACSHGRQALKRAVGTHAGVLTVDRDIGWLVDLAPELGAAACGLAHELVEVIVGAVRVRQPSCTARIAGLVVSFIFFVAGAY